MIRFLRDWGGALLGAAFFLSKTWGGLHRYFSSSEVELIYASRGPLDWIYGLAGWHAAAFEGVNLALWLGAIFAVYWLARKLTRSRTAAGAAALLAAYHARLIPGYLDIARAGKQSGWFLIYAIAAIAAGWLLDRVMRWLLDLGQPSNQVRARIYASTILIVGVALSAMAWTPAARLDDDSEENRDVVRQIHKAEPKLRIGAKLLLRGESAARVGKLIRLSYRDRTIAIADQGDPARFDHVFEKYAGHYLELRAPWQRPVAPMVGLDRGVARIFHEDGSLVTAEHAAHPGELIRAVAYDLENAPFTAAVNHVPAEGRRSTQSIDGASAQIDVAIPANMYGGPAWLELTQRGVSGPAVEFAVR